MDSLEKARRSGNLGIQRYNQPSPLNRAPALLEELCWAE